MKIRTISLSILVTFGMIALSACGGVSLSTNSPTAALPAPTQSSPALVSLPAGTGNLLAAYQGTLENLYTNVSPSVVNIHVVQQVANTGSSTAQLPAIPFFGLPQQQQPQQQFQEALGSGFVWDQQGHIVTNNHVVNGASKIDVTFSDGSTVPATLVGADPDSDLAVIKVNVPASQLKPVQLTDSNNVKVGELTVAIGDPFGLQGTMTTGIVSAVGRSLPANSNATQSYTIPDIIQTDAAINPGNSGGVLINSDGQVIGVTSAIESSTGANAGIGFAIPSDIVSTVVPELIKNGKYVHSWLGISGTSLTPDLATAMNLPADQRGALVENVVSGGPADKAGLVGSSQQTTINGQTVNVGGDVITAIDNQPVLQMDDLIAYLEGTKVNQKVKLTIVRNGKQQTLDVTLAARPAQQPSNQLSLQTNQAGVQLGIFGTTVDASIAQDMNLPSNQTGVLVVTVQPNSLANTMGLRGSDKSVTINGQDVKVGGDIITAVDGHPITTIDELRAILGQLSPSQDLSLTILRNGKQTQITINPGQ